MYFLLKKTAYKVIHNVMLYFIIWLVAFSLIYHFGIYKQTPNEYNVVQWDAGWFERIKNHGYFYSNTEQSSVPFFPAFAYTWKYLEKWFNISKLEICQVNFIFFLIGFGILIYTYEISSSIESLLIMSAPCLFFMYVPYSEGLFYVFCSLIIYGLKKEKIWATILGLFLASMTRSIFLFVLPCILVTEIFYIQPIRKKIQNILIFSVSSFLGLFVVVWFQWQKTGVWFAFYKALKHWGNKEGLKLPLIPLNTWDKPEIMFVDMTAIWIGIISIMFLLWIFWKLVQQYKKHKFHFSLYTVDNKLDKPILFTLTYLGFVSFFGLFVKQEFISSDRYVFGTIFYSVFILYMYRNYELTLGSILTSLITYLILFYLALPIQAGENQTMQFRIILTLVLILAWFLYFYLKNWQYRNYIMYSIIFVSFCIQVYLYQRFISGMWAG